MTTLQDMQKGLIAHMQQYADMVDRINASLGIDPNTMDMQEFYSQVNKLYHRIDELEKKNAELTKLAGYWKCAAEDPSAYWNDDDRIPFDYEEDQ